MKMLSDFAMKINAGRLLIISMILDNHETKCNYVGASRIQRAQFKIIIATICKRQSRVYQH